MAESETNSFENGFPIYGPRFTFSDEFPEDVSQLGIDFLRAIRRITNLSDLENVKAAFLFRLDNCIAIAKWRVENKSSQEQKDPS